jgi:putative endonuclease
VSWFVYVLRCNGGTLYTGITTDPERRLAAHLRGVASKYTRSRLPVKLIYRESHESHSAALKREAEIKRLRRGAKLDLVRGAGCTRPG